MYWAVEQVAEEGTSRGQSDSLKIGEIPLEVTAISLRMGEVFTAPGDVRSIRVSGDMFHVLSIGYRVSALAVMLLVLLSVFFCEYFAHSICGITRS